MRAKSGTSLTIKGSRLMRLMDNPAPSRGAPANYISLEAQAKARVSVVRLCTIARMKVLTTRSFSAWVQQGSLLCLHLAGVVSSCS